MLSQLVIWKVSPKVFIGSREAPSDHKWLCYCFTDRKAKICALNMQADEILKSTGMAFVLEFLFYFAEIFFFFLVGVGGCMCKYVASNSCTNDWLQGMVQIPQPTSPLLFCWDMPRERERQLSALEECTLEWHPRQSTLACFAQSVIERVP